jgi:hypothetical protein
MAAPTKKESGQTPEPPTPTNARKAWTPKSPIDVVLDQIKRQEDRVSRLQAEIDAEKLTLTKLRKAKEILEA